MLTSRAEILIAMLMAFPGCRTFAQAPAARLAGSSWRLVKFQASDGKAITPDDRSKYTISFGEDGGVSVRIDCNRGRGTWKTQGPNQLEFGPLALTRAMCPPAPLNDRLPKDWQNVRSYALKNHHLFLSLMADGGAYEFEPLGSANQPAASGGNTAPPLENTYWRLTRLGDTSVTTGSQQQEAHLMLNHGRVSGSGGCNRITGSYKLNGARLTFSQMASTMMACLDGMDTEKAFLKVLTQARTWKIAGEQLDLYDAAGRLVARLEARNTK